MTEPSDDLVFRQLARLERATPDAIHSASVRARCHAALARQRRRHETPAEVRQGSGGRVAVALAASLSLVYLSQVIRDALAILGQS